MAGLKTQLEREAKTPAHSQEELDRFKQRVDAFNRQARARSGAIDGYNAEVRAQNEKVTKFKEGCAGHKFFTSDLDGIRGDLPFDQARGVKRPGELSGCSSNTRQRRP